MGRIHTSQAAVHAVANNGQVSKRCCLLPPHGRALKMASARVPDASDCVALLPLFPVAYRHGIRDRLSPTSSGHVKKLYHVQCRS